MGNIADVVTVELLCWRRNNTGE